MSAHQSGQLRIPRYFSLATGLVLLVALGAVAQAGDASVARADVILDQYVEAIGGVEALSKLRTRVTRSTMEVGWFTVRSESRQIWPDIASEVSTTSFFGEKRASSGYDGKLGWIQEMGEDPRPLRGKELTDYVLAHRLDAATRLRELYPGRRRLPDGKVEGQACHVVELESANGTKAMWFFDARSGLLTKTRSQRTKDGETRTITTYLGDYRVVDGVLMPFRIHGNDGDHEFEITVESVVHNEPVTLPPNPLTTETGD